MGLFKKRTQKDEPRPGRTPIRSEPSKIFSYHAARNAGEYGERTRLRPEAALDARSTSQGSKLSARLPLVLTAVVLLVCVGYNLVLSNSPRVIIIGNVDETAVLLREQKEYEDEASLILRSSPLNRTKVTFMTADIDQRLTDQFPELASVDVSLPLLGQKPLIYIEPAEPVVALVAQNGASYALDSNGRIISTDVRHVPSTVPYLNDQSGLELELGKQALPSSSVAYILEVLHQLLAKNIGIESIVLPPGVQEVQLRPKGESYYVRMSLREDARAQAGAYIALREQLVKKNIHPSKYVDVRVGERVYYR